MERLKIGDCTSSIVIDVTPSALRELAGRLEARAKVSGIGTSVYIPITNSVSMLYNVSIKDVESRLNEVLNHDMTGQTIN